MVLLLNNVLLRPRHEVAHLVPENFGGLDPIDRAVLRDVEEEVPGPREEVEQRMLKVATEVSNLIFNDHPVAPRPQPQPWRPRRPGRRVHFQPFQEETVEWRRYPPDAGERGWVWVSGEELRAQQKEFDQWKDRAKTRAKAERHLTAMIARCGFKPLTTNEGTRFQQPEKRGGCMDYLNIGRKPAEEAMRKYWKPNMQARDDTAAIRACMSEYRVW